MAEIPNTLTTLFKPDGWRLLTPAGLNRIRSAMTISPVTGSGKTAGAAVVLKFCRTGYAYGSKINAHPFRWNKTAEEPFVMESKYKQKRYWYLNLLVALAYSFYVIARCAHVQLDAQVPLGTKAYVFFLTVYYCIVPLLCLIIVAKQSEIPLGSKVNLDLMKLIIAETGMENCHRTFTVGGWFFTLVYYGFNAITVSMGIANYMQPTSPQFLSSAFLGKEAHLLQKLPFMLFQVYYQNFFHAMTFLMIFGQVPCAFVSNGMFTELGAQIRRSPPRFFKTFYRFVLRYRRTKFGIEFAGQMNHVAVLYNVVGVSTLSGCCTAVIVRLLSHADDVLVLLIPFDLIFTVYILALISFLSKASMEKSTEFLGPLKHSIPRLATEYDRKLALRYFWSLSPARMPCGPFGYLRNTFVLETAAGIINLTLNILLVFS